MKSVAITVRALCHSDLNVTVDIIWGVMVSIPLEGVLAKSQDMEKTNHYSTKNLKVL